MSAWDGSSEEPLICILLRIRPQKFALVVWICRCVNSVKPHIQPVELACVVIQFKEEPKKRNLSHMGQGTTISNYQERDTLCVCVWPKSFHITRDTHSLPALCLVFMLTMECRF